MKRKKWSELEEQTLLSKYSDLLNSGALAKLKTREKKFRPIAEHVNGVHHLADPTSFPFKWSWRDVSIKVQNMRHQYLGVKQKIRVSEDEFNWKDGEIHWENFLRYKEVFGDVELETKGKKAGGDGGGCGGSCDFFKECCELEFGIDTKGLRQAEEGEDDSEECKDGVESEGDLEGAENADKASLQKRLRGHGKLGLLVRQVTELRMAAIRREEKRREREFNRRKKESEREADRRQTDLLRLESEEKIMSMELKRMETELEEQLREAEKKEIERSARTERELEERRWRRRVEEQREEEEMEWRERLLGMQMAHEKAVMQMYLESYQNQMQVFRLLIQLFGSPNDGLGSSLGILPHQLLQNLQHSGRLDDTCKPESNSPSEFI